MRLPRISPKNLNSLRRCLGNPAPGIGRRNLPVRIVYRRRPPARIRRTDQPDWQFHNAGESATRFFIQSKRRVSPSRGRYDDLGFAATTVNLTGIRSPPVGEVAQDFIARPISPAPTSPSNTFTMWGNDGNDLFRQHHRWAVHGYAKWHSPERDPQSNHGTRHLQLLCHLLQHGDRTREPADGLTPQSRSAPPDKWT